MPVYLGAALLFAALLAGASYLHLVEYRAAAVRLIGFAGVILGIGLAIGGANSPWRTLTGDRDLMVLAGVGIAAGWALILSLDQVEGHAAAAACLAVGACALPFIATSAWLAPTLMFLALFAVAAALSAHLEKHPVLLAQGALGLGFVGAGLALARGESWVRPSSFGAPETALLIVGAVILVWPLDRFGGWDAAGRPAAAFLPLLHAAAFAALAAADLGPQPWAASGILAAALGSALWHGVRSPERFRPGPLAGGAALAAAVVIPELAVPAGIATVLASTSAALGAPYGFGAGFLGGAVPLTASWLVLLTAVSRAFRLAGGSAELTDRLPWLVFVSLAPLVMTAGVIGAVRWVRQARLSGRLRAFAGEGALLVSLLAAALPAPLLRLVSTPLGERGRVLWLVIVAALAAAGAGSYMQSRSPATETVSEESVSPARREPERGPTWFRRGAEWAGWAAVAAVAGMTVFLTFKGLKVGFL